MLIYLSIPSTSPPLLPINCPGRSYNPLSAINSKVVGMFCHFYYHLNHNSSQRHNSLPSSSSSSSASSVAFGATWNWQDSHFYRWRSSILVAFDSEWTEIETGSPSLLFCNSKWECVVRGKYSHCTFTSGHQIRDVIHSARNSSVRGPWSSNWIAHILPSFCSFCRW